jgi:hypothetical protein
VGFQVLTAVAVRFKFNIFWHEKPYSLVEVYQRFTGTYCFHLQDRRVSKHITVKNEESLMERLGHTEVWKGALESK